MERPTRPIERRPRHRRVLAVSIAIGVLVAAGAAARTAFDGRGAVPATPAAPAVQAPDTTRRGVFVPPVRRDRGRLVLPLTFPDGSTAELVYGPELDLDALGVQPDVSFLRRDRPAARFSLSFWFGQPGTGLLEGTRPVERYPTLRGGQAELWRASASPPGQGYWLAFKLASWTVLAPASTPAEAAEAAGSLDARETGDGYVVMEAVAPLALAREGGEGGGPQLAIGDASPRPEEVDAGTRFRLITLRPSRSCRGEGISPSGQHASACLGAAGGGAVFAGIDGDRSFVEAVLTGLDARNVRMAP